MKVFKKYFKKGDLVRSRDSYYKVIDIAENSVYLKGMWYVRRCFAPPGKYPHLEKMVRYYNGIRKIPINSLSLDKLTKREIENLIDVVLSYFYSGYWDDEQEKKRLRDTGYSNEADNM